MLGEGSLDHWVKVAEMLLPWIGICLAGALLVLVVAIVILNLLDARRLLKQKAVFIELTPPAQTDKTPEANRRLFSVLHGLEAGRTFLDRILRHKATFSLELVSTKNEGIRYILRAAEHDAPTLEQAIISHLSDVKFRRVDDYIPDTAKPARILEIKQSGHFAYPLKSQGELWEHDPMAYLTGAMTKLADNELITLQIVVTPTKVREAYTISKRLLHNEELVSRLGKRKLPIFGPIFSVINGMIFAVLDGVGSTVNGPSKIYQSGNAHTQHQQQVAMKIKPARVLSPIEQRLAESVHEKLNQPLFGVNIRALVIADGKQEAKQRVKNIYDWLELFRVAKYQVLKSRLTLFPKLQRRFRLFSFKHRLPSIFRGNSNIFSASEIADLYHFPHTETTKTENVAKSLSRTLAAPISLKGRPNLDIILGNNHHHSTTTPIGLTTRERERHVYIIGGTGHGKTTMQEYGIVQDIMSGRGVGVIDPHGDMAEKLLGYIPEERINDVVYFNPDDLSYPIGLNMLELPEGLEGDDLLRAKDLVAESVISVFRKIFSSDDSGGHRIEYVLRNAIQTALTVENATLFTIYDLLNDPDYRKKVVSKLEDKTLKNFWLHEISKAGGMQQVKMVAGITAKVGRFLFSASAKRILEQPKSTIDFGDILNGKILICNFSKGLLGEDTSELFGIAVLAKIQVAALQRARTKQTERRPFYLYVDEFQNFATMSFVQMLSEARKYKLFLTMAEQSTSQQDDQQMVNVILANVGTIICFRTGNPADERLILPLFRPYIEEGEIANLPSFNFYMRISAIQAQEPFSGETIVLEGDGDEAIADKVIAASRKNHAIEYKPPVKPEAKEPKKPTVKIERKSDAKTKEEPRKKRQLPKKDGLKKRG
jgi:hypothetical protein